MYRILFLAYPCILLSCIHVPQWEMFPNPKGRYYKGKPAASNHFAIAHEQELGYSRNQMYNPNEDIGIPKYLPIFFTGNSQKSNHFLGSMGKKMWEFPKFLRVSGFKKMGIPNFSLFWLQKKVRIPNFFGNFRIPNFFSIKFKPVKSQIFD